MFIIRTKESIPAFAIGCPNMLLIDIQNGFGVFIESPGDQTFKVAREIGAVILDVQEKGITKIGELPK